MDINVEFVNNDFELSLDACIAKLNASEMLLLREKLSQELLKPLKKPIGFWEEQQIQLDKLKYIAFALAELDKQSLENIIANNAWCDWVSLLGFTRLTLPKLADTLQSIIENRNNKKNYLFFSSPEDFIDSLHLNPAISIIDVVASLKEMQEALNNSGPEMKELLNKQQQAHTKTPQKATSTKIQPVSNDKVFSFLDYLGGLPASNLKLILKRISREELSLLFSTCKMLKAVKLFSQLKAIFPEKIFQQLEKNCPEKIDEYQVRSLLNKLNSELKKLKELLNNRSQ